MVMNPANPAGPSVTVLMTMFNAAAHLRASVGSVLSQTFGDFEFVIVDDGSRDDSAAIVESYRDARIRLVRNERNKGQTPCLNQGLALARGAWVARQDADDISLPRRLERQVEKALETFERAIAGSRCSARRPGRSTAKTGRSACRRRRPTRGRSGG